MVPQIFPALTAFLLSLFALPIIIRYSNKRNLFVQLDQRKIHKKITPSMGGIAIFFGLCVSSLIWIDLDHFNTITAVLMVLVVPFLIGFLDDRFHLKPSRKIAGQLIAASLTFFLLDIKVSSLPLISGNYAFPEWLSYGVTVTVVILVTNSFNLIDGIDGLAGTFSIVAFSFLGFWFAQMELYTFAIISFSLIGSTAAFLLKNWQPSKIFMGDTGSLLLGMSLSILCIAFVSHNDQLPAYHALKFTSSLGTVLCILIVPTVDTIRVVIIRFSRGISPLTADKRHIHHALVRIGKSHRFAVLLLFIVHIFFIINALLLKQFSDWYVIGSVTLYSTILCFILDRVIARHTFPRRSHHALLSVRRGLLKL